MCGPGRFTDALHDDRRCLPCAADYYNADFGAESCIACPAGRVTADEGADSSADCCESRWRSHLTVHVDGSHQLRHRECDVCRTMLFKRRKWRRIVDNRVCLRGVCQH